VRLPLASGAPTRILSNGTVAGDPAPSPDGAQIAFVVADYPAAQADIYVVARDGTGLRQLTDDPTIDDEPAWSPDGTRIAFRSFRSERDGEIWVMDADGSDQRNLTPRAGTAVVDFRRPAWSPDGSRIAYASTEGGDWGIWTMAADGSDRRQLTNTIDLDTEPTWSPDGQRIAFRRSSAEEGSDIMIVPAAGGEAVRLALAGEQRTPAWSPDGELIAFAGQPGLTDRPELYTMRPDGSDVRLLTTDPAWGGGLNPSWLRR
jgi:Tol biopolymer transport system component